MPEEEEKIMSKRKKRNAVILTFLLLALAVLCGVYFWYSNKAKNKEEEEEDTPQIDVMDIDTEQIKSMHYVREDADIILIKKDDVWISESEPDRPIKQTNVTNILNAIKSIKAYQVVAESPDNLADFGLEKPVAILEVNLNDGSTVTVKIGNEVIHSMGYYGMVNDDGKVYQMSKDLGLAMRYSNTDMTELGDTPDIDSANVTYIKVTYKNGTEYELKKLDEKVYSNAGNTLCTWRVLKPYGIRYSADEEKMQELQGVYAGITYLACVDYKAEDLSKYGLDDPEVVVQVGYNVAHTEKLETPEKDPDTGEEITEKTIYDPHDYTLYIGSKDEDGNYYVAMKGSKAVYTMDNNRIDKMINLDPFSLLDSYVMMPNISEVDKINVVTEGKQYNMEIKRRTEKDDEGKDKTVSSYFFNGKESEEKPFKTMYQTMISTMYDSEIKEEISLEGLEPVLSMSFHLFGDGEGIYSVDFYPYNDSFDIIKMPDGFTFFADKRRVDAVIEAVTTFTGKASKEDQN